MKQKPGAGKCGQNSHRYKDLNLWPALVQTTPCQRQSHLIQRRHLPGTWMTPGTLRTLTWCMRTSIWLMGDKQEVLTRRTVDTYTVVSEPLLSCLAPETPSLDWWSDWQPNTQALKKNQTCPVQARQEEGGHREKQACLHSCLRLQEVEGLESGLFAATSCFLDPALLFCPSLCWVAPFISLHLSEETLLPKRTPELLSTVTPEEKARFQAGFYFCGRLSESH